MGVCGWLSQDPGEELWALVSPCWHRRASTSRNQVSAEGGATKSRQCQFLWATGSESSGKVLLFLSFSLSLPSAQQPLTTWGR